MWERNIDWLPLTCASTRAWTHNPSMCPDQESNQQQPFTLWDNTQPTEPHWSGLPHLLVMSLLCQGRQNHTFLLSSIFPIYSSTWCNEKQAHLWLSHPHCKMDCHPVLRDFSEMAPRLEHIINENLDDIKIKPINWDKWKASIINNSW